ncbi:MAG: ribbon-helix-helix protein, CopG family [Acidobacteriota bacterium]
MHRTQIILDDAQYVALREKARRTGKSMGQLIRELLAQQFEPGAKPRRGKASGLAKMTGILKDPGFGGEDHDDVLYGGR